MKTSKTSKAILAGSLVAGALFGLNSTEVKANDLFNYNDLGSAGQVRSALLNDFMNPSAMSNAIELKCGETKKAGDAKAKDAKCGENKKAKDAKCGEGKKAKDAKCGESKKAKDAKCGEGKCGEKKKADAPKN